MVLLELHRPRCSYRTLQFRNRNPAFSLLPSNGICQSRRRAFAGNATRPTLTNSSNNRILAPKKINLPTPESGGDGW